MAVDGFRVLLNSLIGVCSGSMLPAGILIATGYVSDDVPLAVGLITAAIALSGISYACWPVNHLDLAPQYAGQ